MKEKVETPLSSLFQGHVFVQHERSEWGGSHCAWYQMYLVSENHDLPDAVAFGKWLRHPCLVPSRRTGREEGRR